MYSQRDIVLIPIPYTNLKSYKQRPVVIISTDEYNSTFEDVIVVAVTSNPELIKFTIPLDNGDLEEGKLKVSSMIRPDKIYTLHQGIIIKKFGKVSRNILEEIKTAIGRLIG